MGLWCKYDICNYKKNNVKIERKKNKKRRDDAQPYVVPIIKLDKCNNIIEEYKSVIEASKQNNILDSSISNCLNGRSKTSGGYIWKHKYENK